MTTLQNIQETKQCSCCTKQQTHYGSAESAVTLKCVENDCVTLLVDTLGARRPQISCS